MNYKTHNEKDITVAGTSLQGCIDLDYNDIVEKLGEPQEGDVYKVDAEWDIEFSNGVIATIYNWKDGKNYNGNDGLDVQDITDWHIGGHNHKAVESVLKLFK